MSLILSGSDGVSDIDGSASTPAIRGTDTNTGIFFGSDIIGFSEGGAEVARFNADAQFVAAAGTASLPVITTTGDVNTGIFFPAADTIAFAEGGAEVARFDSGGRLLVNRTATGGSLFDNCNIQVTGNISISRSDPELVIQNTGSAAKTWRILGSSGAGSVAAFRIYDGSSDADRIYISTTGEVYIAGISDQGPYNLQVNGTGVWAAGAYVNASDSRIKDNITPINSGLDVVSKLNPVTYKYKEEWSKDQSTQTGFIAQELLVALEGKNYLDGVVQQNGENKYMSVAYQNIIPILTKAIQEQQAIITDLKSRIETLEAK
jgi:hypothetical protein